MVEMRGQAFALDTYVHMVKRGARGLPIVRSESDQKRFLKILYYLNDEHVDHDWDNLSLADPFYRPTNWPVRKPLVTLLAFTLMPNHIHLLAKEIQEGGISKFMQKTCQSMTNYHNKKYQEKGSIFQGPYGAHIVENDTYFRYVSAYIMVKNVFELYPQGGLAAAMKNFEDAWQWSIKYPFSSLGAYARNENSPIIQKELLNESFRDQAEFKDFSRDVIVSGKWIEEDLI